MKITKIIFGIMAAVILTVGIAGCGVQTTTVNSNSIAIAEEEEEVTTTEAKELIMDNEQFSMRINYGLNGVIVGNSWFPVNVILQNKGEDFTGTVKIILPSVQKNVAYEKAFTLAFETEKTVSITIPGIGNFGKFRVEIKDEDGKTVFKKDIRTGLNENLYENQLLVGILSDDYSAMKYFNNQILNLSSTNPIMKTLPLDETTFPDDVSVLNTLSYLIINQFTTEKLSEEQMETLMDWVDQGGILVLGTGASAKKVLSGFSADYLSGTIGKTTKNQIFINNNNSKAAEVSCANLVVDQGKVISDIISGANLWRITKKEGNIIIADFDLGAQGINVWEQRDQFATQFLEKILTDTVTSNLKEQYFVNDFLNNMTDVLNFYRGIKIPELSFYILLFTIYILVIGPVGYFLLKKKDKREWLWIFVPVVALCFNGVIFLLSVGSRVHTPVATTISIVDSTNPVWQEKIYASLLNPDGKKYTAELSEECQKISPLEYSYYYNDEEFSLDQYRYSVENRKNGTNINFEKEEAFSNDMLTMERTIKNESSGFQKKLSLYTDKITGSVTNQTGYDLTEVRLVYNGMYVDLGNMKNGETKTIKDSDTHKFTQTYIYDLGSTLVSNMKMETVDQRTTYQLFRNLYTFFAGRFQAMNTGDGYLFGIVDQYNQDYIKNTDIEEMGKALIFESFQEFPKDVGDYYIRNITSEAIQDNSGDINVDGTMLYSENAEVTYQFDENVTIKKVFADRATADNYNMDTKVIVWAWNYKTEKYEQVFDITKSLTKEQQKNYIQNNQMKLKFETQSGNGELPIISVTGG